MAWQVIAAALAGAVIGGVLANQGAPAAPESPPAPPRPSKPAKRTPPMRRSQDERVEQRNAQSSMGRRTSGLSSAVQRYGGVFSGGRGGLT